METQKQKELDEKEQEIRQLKGRLELEIQKQQNETHKEQEYAQNLASIETQKRKELDEKEKEIRLLQAKIEEIESTKNEEIQQLQA